MSENNFAEIEADIKSQINVLDDLFEKADKFVTRDLPNLGRDWKTAYIVVGLIDSYYTAAETVLFRIAQKFGNQVNPERWHADLLDRLSHEVKNVRPQILKHATYTRLDELRRFRHFSRYYFQAEFDWDKLDFLIKKHRELHPLLLEDLESFCEFLSALE